MSERNEPVTIDVECIGESRDALYVTDGDVDTWIPKSQILDDEGVSERGDVGSIEIPRWLAEDRGFI